MRKRKLQDAARVQQDGVKRRCEPASASDVVPAARSASRGELRVADGTDAAIVRASLGEHDIAGIANDDAGSSGRERER